jgi:hypothetical protein
MSKVIAVRRKYGRIEQYKLNDGRILDFNQCWHEVDRGLIDNLQNIIRDDGVLVIKSLPDEDMNNNLDSLPEF